MPTILFDIPASPGTVDRSRSDVPLGTVVTVTAGGVVGTAVFGLLDRPLGSSAALAGAGLTRTVTADVTGPYRVRVIDDNDDSEAVHTFTVRTLGLQLALPASNEKANQSANDVENDAADILASETNEGGTFKGWHDVMIATLRRLEQAVARYMGTGLLEGGVVTEASPTTVDITAGKGQITDYSDPELPLVQPVEWEAQFGVVVAAVATTDTTLFCFDKDGVLSQLLLSTLDPLDRVRCILPGSVAHASGAILADSTAPQTLGYDGHTTLVNFLSDVIGPANEKGNVFGPNGANLSVNCSGGTVFSLATNFRTEPELPDSPDQAPAVAPSIAVLFRAVGGASSLVHTFTTFLDPSVYDDGSGVVQAVGVNDWTIQRLFRAPGGQLVGALGQVVFNTKSDAIDALLTHAFAEFSPTPELVWRAYLVVRGNATDLSDTGEAEFFEAPKFRIAGSGGAGAPSASTFVALGDTPNSYSGQAGLVPKVNVGETALEFALIGMQAVYDAGPTFDLTGVTGNLIINAIDAVGFFIRDGGANRIAMTSAGGLQFIAAIGEDALIRSAGVGVVEVNAYTFPTLSGINAFVMPLTRGAAGAVLTDALGDGALAFTVPEVPAVIEVNAQVGTTYTLLASDSGKHVTLSNAAAIALTVPTGLGDNFACLITQLGAGQVTLSGAATLLNATPGLKTRVQYSMMGLTATLGTDELIVSGDSEA